MTLEQFVWVEKYRPRKIDDCILPDNIKTTAKAFVAQGDLPNIILSGGPGTGKTTLALAMCHELGIVPLFINGSEESGIDVLRTKIKDFAAALSFDGKRRCIILDEADFLNPNSTQPALRSLMEEYAINCSFILTCNYSNKIIPALHSRCTVVNFFIPKDEKKKLMNLALNRVEVILQTEGVTYNVDTLVPVVKRYWPDVRRMLNEIQAASHGGVLSDSVLGQRGDIDYEPLWVALKGRNYKDARAWIGQNADVDAAKFYRTVFEWFHEAADSSSLPALIVLTGDYQYRHINALDPHVHMAAYVIELMNNGKYR